MFQSDVSCALLECQKTVLFFRKAVQIAASTVVTKQVEETQQSTQEKRDDEKTVEGQIF